MTIQTKIIFKDGFGIQIMYEHNSIEELVQDMESVKKSTTYRFGKAFSKYTGVDIKAIEIMKVIDD